MTIFNVRKFTTPLLCYFYSETRGVNAADGRSERGTSTVNMNVSISQSVGFLSSSTLLLFPPRLTLSGHMEGDDLPVPRARKGPQHPTS